MFTAIKLFFTGLPFKSITLWAIGLLMLSNAIAYGLMYKAKSDAVFWKGEYKSAIVAYDTAEEIRKEQNKTKERKANEQRLIQDAAYKKQLEAFAIKTLKDRESLKAELENAHEKLKLANYRLGAANDRMHLQDAILSATRGEASREAADSETESECNGIATYTRTLERGCAVTTADFNRCSQWIEDVCNIYGCGE